MSAAAEAKLEQVTKMKAKIKGLTAMADGNGTDSDGTADEEGANTVEEFEGWTLEDHHNEMLALQTEFERLAKRHYDDTCLRIEEQIRSVNAGSDPDFKKNLQAVDRKYKSTCQSLEGRKKMELKTCEAQYDGDMYSIGLTYTEDLDWLKGMLIDQVKRRRLRQLEPEPEPEPAEAQMYQNGSLYDDADGGTEEEQWNNETDDDDIKPAKLSKRHKVGGRSPMSHSPVPMHIPRNRPVVEVNDPPVVYMLDQKAFDEDWHAMMRL